MRNFVIKRRRPFFTLFSIIFWLFAFLIAVSAVSLSILSKVNHKKKWSDYDDCGIF